MRVGIICFQQESNTFLQRPTTLADFKRDILITRADIRKEYAHAHHEVGGFFQGLEENHINAIPLVAAWTVPGGTITDECYSMILSMIQTQLMSAGVLDGLLVAPHGAAVSEVHRDMDGHWISMVRQQVGLNMPIVSTLDLHANVSQRMIDAVNATIAYRTNPHLDQRQRGIDAANLLARTLRKEIRPTQAAAFPRVSINIERQLTDQPPCSELLAMADAQLTRGAIANSCVLGFPYADVAEMGSSFIAVTDNDPALARKLADELAGYVVEHRTDFLPELISIDRALDAAMDSVGPVTLLDIGDNIGGGSPGDGTYLLRAMYGRKITSAFVSLFDPESVQLAAATGIGNSARFSLGGKTSPALHGEPLVCNCSIQSLHLGQFTEDQPRHGGRRNYDMGTTAILRVDVASDVHPGIREGATKHPGLIVQVTSRRIPPFSLNQLISCGLDPKSFHILVAKGVHAPAAAYKPISQKLIRVNTPGVTTADPTILKYEHRRKPLFPFEVIEESGIRDLMARRQEKEAL
ncbi:MAG TPA: M81 family metallopeptidase [Tepidisphaeraceae bacterium]|jgi:microcystin degradation protein MlrC